MIKNMAYGVMFLCCSMMTSAYSAEDIVTQVRKCPGDPCVVHDNYGGKVAEFERAAEAIASGVRTRIVIDGLCASACTILIDKVPDRVCLTERAQLHFHKGTEYSMMWFTLPAPSIKIKAVHYGPIAVATLFDPEYSSSVMRWIRAIGGLPKDGGFVVMSDQLARRIWRSCT